MPAKQVACYEGPDRKVHKALVTEYDCSSLPTGSKLLSVSNIVLRQRTKERVTQRHHTPSSEPR